MKTKIGIWGSCATRDIFRSEFNDYNEYFEIVYELERISLVIRKSNSEIKTATSIGYNYDKGGVSILTHSFEVW